MSQLAVVFSEEKKKSWKVDWIVLWKLNNMNKSFSWFAELSNLINLPVDTLNIHHLARIVEVSHWKHFGIAFLDVWDLICFETWIEWNFKLSNAKRLHLKLFWAFMCWASLFFLWIFQFYALVILEWQIGFFFLLIFSLYEKLLCISNELFVIFEKSR